VKYAVLDRTLGKMPSYLRRAAIEPAVGAVSSFQSNWNNFLNGQVAGKPAGRTEARLTTIFATFLFVCYNKNDEAAFDFDSALKKTRNATERRSSNKDDKNTVLSK
jgi:hypothetical protein